MNLIQLLLKNQAKPRNFRSVRNAGEAPTIYLYDIIGGDYYGGISAKQVIEELNNFRDEPVINVRINSPGGDVFEARAIHTAFSQFAGKIVVQIDGVAASAVTWIALSGDEVRIAEGALMMIHNSSTIGWGDKSVMLQTASLLEKIDGTIVTDYVRATGKSAEEVRAWMDAETWFNSDEAIELGFASALADTKSKVSNTWDLSAYKNAPQKQDEPNTEIDEAQIKQHREALERNVALLERIAA